jgi:branched-chain amino acid aminotransferase|tara:strand:+ start:1492 stop:2514 length:1023 start_codon:yes stop_codon:yes gene_type:complete
MVNIEWDKLGFDVVPTKSMFKAICSDGEKWKEGSIIPYGNIELSPAANVLNYGQGAFEGVKAFRTKKGNIVLFRIDKNAARMALSTKRLCIPEMNKSFFINAVMKTVKDNIDYIPPYGQGSLYIRPVIWGTSPGIGVSPASEYTFMVFVSPVGPYFKKGIRPLNLKITDQYHRAAPKGIGNIKAIGNYSASLYPLVEAKNEGFDEVIYLDAADEKRVEEVGSANLFIYKDGIIKTPKLSGSILGGVTRDSVCVVASNILDLPVQETDIYVEDLTSSDEVFCTGTAVVVSPVGRIKFREETFQINQNQMGPITKKIRETILAIQREEIDDSFGWLFKLEND